MLTHCPLCASTGGRDSRAIPYASIWRDLETRWGASISDSVKRRHALTDEAVLRRCDSCGLDWFVGAVPGDADFYRELMADVPYSAERWDFAMVRPRLKPADRIVDFGSGAGLFLRSLEGRVARRVAVDHNDHAIGRLPPGVEGHSAGFAEFAAGHAESFDVVTAFHVIEHVGDVAGFLRTAVDCLAPGGRLFLATPNRDRLPEAPLESLDCPPHHVTRWSAAQWRPVAETLGLQLDRFDFEEPDYGKVSALRLEPVDARLAPIRRPRLRRVVRGAARHAIIGPRKYDRDVKHGRLAQRGWHGHGMLAEFVKPGPPARGNAVAATAGDDQSNSSPL